MEANKNDTPQKPNPAEERRRDDMTPQDYLRQIKANYPDLKQNLEIKAFVRIAPTSFPLVPCPAFLPLLLILLSINFELLNVFMLG